MHIVVAGHFGYGNLGDEALLTTMLRGLTVNAPAHSSTIVSGNPSATKATHGVDAIPPTADAVIGALRRTDLVVLGPGGVLHDSPMPGRRRRQGGMSLYYCIAAAAQDIGVPTALFNIGVGPVESSFGRRIVRSLFESAAYVSPRDGPPPPGTAVAHGPSAPDLAWAFAAPATAEHAAGRYIAVSVRPFIDAGTTETFLETLAEALLERLRSGREDSVVIVPMQSHGQDSDIDLSLALSARMGGRTAEVVVPNDVQHAFRLFGEASVSIVVRRHAAIASLLGCLPTVGITYDRKVDLVFEAVGMPDAVLSPTAGPDQLVRALEHAESNADLLPGAVDQQRLAAEATIRQFGRFLHELPDRGSSESSKGRWAVRRQATRMGIVLGPPCPPYRRS